MNQTYGQRHKFRATDSPIRENSKEFSTISNFDENRESKAINYKTGHVTPRQTDLDLIQNSSALKRPVAADSGEYNDSMMHTKMMKTSSGGFGNNLVLTELDTMIDIKNTTQTTRNHMANAHVEASVTMPVISTRSVNSKSEMSNKFGFTKGSSFRVTPNLCRA